MGRGGSTLPPPKGGFSASELVDYYNNHRVKWTGRSFITHLRVGLVSHLEMTTREFCCCARLLPCQCGFFYLYSVHIGMGCRVPRAQQDPCPPISQGKHLQGQLQMYTETITIHNETDHTRLRQVIGTRALQAANYCSICVSREPSHRFIPTAGRVSTGFFV